MIAIVNYGSGNIQAIGNIYTRLRIPFTVVTQPEELVAAERIILPGVGAFDQAMNELDASGMREALDRAVLQEKKPILGICVGMQLLAHRSEEGSAKGLGWIDGAVKRFDQGGAQQVLRLPHMGWNTVAPRRVSPLFRDVDLETGYYFLHSYYFSCNNPEDQLAVANYGKAFTCVVQRANVYGVQFHPEKSHQAGIRLLKNFAAIE